MSSIYDMPYNQYRELPSFSLRQEDLPEMLKWEVNGKYYLLLKVEMVGIRNRKDLESKEEKTKLESDFKVLSVGAVDNKPIDTATLEKREFEGMIARVRSGEYT